jgi:glycosyltransferase involved in cell wall biosynthesis
MDDLSSLQVLMDGIIFELQAQGGISRIYQEILPRMCELEDSLRITLFGDQRAKQAPPEHAHIRPVQIQTYRQLLRPGSIWMPVLTKIRDSARQRRLGSGAGQIWHSTYYTFPRDWAGYQVLTIHDMIYELFADLFNTRDDQWVRTYKRLCVQNADMVICVSESTKNDLVEYYQLKDKEIRVIYSAYSRVFKPIIRDDIKPDYRNLKPFFLYIGRRLRYKNFGHMLRAYSLWPSRDSVDLLIVDRTPWSSEERKLLEELGVEGSVHLHLNVTDEELCQLYNQAEALIYPSLYEGFGIPLLEAMACGCPVIASRIPSTIEVAGEIPFYFEPDSIGDLCATLDQALSAGKHTPRTRQGLEKVKEYSWDKTALQTLNVYRDFFSSH